MRTGFLSVIWGAAAVLPLAALAVSTSRQELQDALRAKPDPTNGAELFETCAACHGPNGSGTSDGAVPAIGGQHFRVLAKQLVDFRNDKRWDIRMEHFADRHHLRSAQDIADVAGHVSQLDPGPQLGIGNGESIGNGASVYFRHCESCHGPSGKGSNERQVPQLAGQHYEYLLRQMYDTADGRRPNMSTDHVRMFQDLELQDFVGVADYLSRLTPASRAPASQ